MPTTFVKTHRLSAIDKDLMTATCSHCGPTKIRIHGRGQRRGAICITSVKDSSHGSNLARRYGITRKDLALLMSVQDGLCAICKTPDTPEQPLHVDHCHTTGRVRGLLCFRCNNGLGAFQDNIKVMVEATEYLRMYAEAPTPAYL